MDDKCEELQASLIEVSGQLDHAEGAKLLRLLADAFSDEDGGRAAIKAALKAMDESRLRHPSES